MVYKMVVRVLILNWWLRKYLWDSQLIFNDYVREPLQRHIKNTNKETVRQLDLERDDTKNSLAHNSTARSTIFCSPRIKEKP